MNTEITGFSDYPYPVAAPYRLLMLETNAASSVNRIFDLVEISLRYAGFCVASEMIQHGSVERVAPWFERPLTVGAIHGWMREEFKKQGRGAFGGFSRELGRVYSDSSFLSQWDELIAARNQVRGHGVTLSEKEYRALDGRLLPSLQTVVEALSMMKEYKPVIVKGINNFDGTWHEHQLSLAVGDNPFFPVETINVNKPLKFRDIFLMSPDRKLLPLYPFMIFRECGKCGEPHVFLYQSPKHERADYLSPVKGCTVRLEKSGTELLDELERQSEKGLTQGTGGKAQKLHIEPGFELAGRYKILGLLGRGAGGTVFRAEDSLTSHRVAIKVMDPESDMIVKDSPTRPGEMIKRFQREAKAISMLSHPSLVSVFDVGIDRGLHYYSMDLIEGANLREKIRQGPIDLGEATMIVDQLLGALAVAHDHGIIHRDIKPENIIIQHDGTVKLMDFGVARMSGRTTITSSGEIVGTAGYMAPEQVNNEKVSNRTDYFALGVLLFEMVTGQRPFDGLTFRETITNIVNKEPQSPSSLNPKLPKWFDRSMEKILSKNVEDRPADPTQFHALLEGPPEKASEEKNRIIEKLKKFFTTEKPDLNCVYPIQVRDLEMSFGKHKNVLRKLALDIPKGQRYCLLGRNGAGKTTLIKCLMGIYEVDSGSVRIFNSGNFRYNEINRYIGYIPEKPQGYPFLKLGEYLNHMAGLYPEWDRRFVVNLMNRFNLRPNEKIKSMSRGMKTIVSIITAFAHRPPLLIFDDPTLGLDAFWKEDFINIVSELSEQRGTTVFFTTHSFETVDSIADRIGFLNEGRLSQEIDMSEVKRKFQKINIVLPDDSDPERLPSNFTITHQRKRTISGIFQITDVRAEEAFSPLNPASFSTSMASMKDVYFHVLRKSHSDELEGIEITNY